MTLPASGPISLGDIATEFGGAAPHSISEYYGAAAGVPTSGAISLGDFHGKSANIVGQAEYTTSGSYTFTVPAGVTSVCAVCVGPGGNADSRAGGGGGGLAYKNNIAVTPGQNITVVVGAPPVDNTVGAWGTNSKFGTYCEAGAGQNSSNTRNTGGLGGGLVTGDGGGTGGQGGGGGSGNSGAGGGAAGYTGNGGAGAGSGTGSDGAGGGGGGGYGGASTSGSGAGGGVGIYGQGANGTGGTSASSGGKGGSSGTDGGPYSGWRGGAGGEFGGGGGGNDNNTFATNFGGSGAVRIIWGAGRAFPSTNTGNL